MTKKNTIFTNVKDAAAMIVFAFTALRSIKGLADLGKDVVVVVDEKIDPQPK